MKVSELIRLLSQCDMDADVLMVDDIPLADVVEWWDGGVVYLSDAKVAD
jgi:hypothetical protein